MAEYADAYNARDPEALRTFFALDDHRFAVFEDYSGKLFDGGDYRAILESVFDATAEMSFDLLRCDRFGDFAVIHAMQRIEEQDEEEGISEARIRATLWVSISDGSPRIVTAHYSLLPESGTGGCFSDCCQE
ncbi:MAG: nuclear transport factor 2 family protein [Deltaproteobacteria bacterium]|nr:nuclear transport factor 2 family protein [Deltaproteobacteria bacterium]